MMARKNKKETPEKESFYEAMGLTEEQFEDVHDFIHEIEDKYDTKSEMLNAIDDEFTTQNEILVGAYLIGAHSVAKSGIAVSGKDIVQFFEGLKGALEEASKR